MEKFKITGMTCSACVSRVERAVSCVDGVQSCSVSLLTNSMTVQGGASNEDIIKAVQGAGYGAEVQSGTELSLESKTKRESRVISRRLVLSVLLVLVLMYLSMGYKHLSLPLPAFLDNYVTIAIMQMIIAGAVLVINKRFFINGAKGILNKSPNMDTLVSLGSGFSYLYSLIATGMMIFAKASQDTPLLEKWWGELYFESSAMILALITVGKTLEAYSKGKTTSALSGLLSLRVKTVTVLEDGEEKEIPCEQIRVGDEFIVKTGGGIPVDAEITEGSATLDESMLTGESIPTDKTVGQRVYAGTINKSGYIKCRAREIGEDTVLSQIIKAVTESSSSKAPVARVADKVAGVFVPIVMSIALLTVFVWLIAGQGIGFALARGISVLVISCPCALGLATPVAIMVGNGVGARNGILFKNATSLENLCKVKTVVLDKTGTITKGEISVTDIIPLCAEETELLRIAGSLEKMSEHPIAQAIVKRCNEMGITSYDVFDFKSLTGNGVCGIINSSPVLIGSHKLFEDELSKANVKGIFEELTGKGKTPVFVKKGDTLLGIIGVRDEVKADSASAIDKLKRLGLCVVMLTGDNERSARAIADLVGIDKVIAEVMPTQKESVIKELKKSGKVAMVGDGVNDSPSLASADVGIAMGNGTEIAIDTADVVLMRNTLTCVANAITLSRKTLKNIYENLFWAFIYNVIGIPLATGAFIPLFGWELKPMLGALAMSLSSICVVTNALRLNLIKFDKNKKEQKMKETIKVEGMMCPHCEARVKNVLEAIEGVCEAVPSHKKKNVILTLSEGCDKDAVLSLVKEAITKEGYKIF